MKKGMATAIAALLIVIAGWVTQQDCTGATIQCNVDYFLKFTKALSGIVASVPNPPL